MTDTVPLYQAIRPHGNREDAGEHGEKCHALAYILESKGVTTTVPKDATASDVIMALLAIGMPPTYQSLQRDVVAILEENATKQPMSLGQYMAQSNTA